MPDIEYFYSAHSAYAYIGSATLMEIADRAGARLIHKPMDLRRAIAAAGPGATNRLTDARKDYFSGRSIQRWAEYRGAELNAHWPSAHDHDIELPNCVLIAAIDAGNNIDQLAHAMLQAHWRDDADLDDAPTLASIASSIGMDAVPLLEAAGSDDIRAIHEANTKEAIERSVFGSPTYFVGGDMFYGQDNLELVARALEKPFSGAWPSAWADTWS